MKFNVDKIKKELKFFAFGQKGWLKNSDKCPFCGTSEKWGIMFTKDSSGIFNCFKGGCGVKTSLYNYLKEISRDDLCSGEIEVSVNNSLKSIKTVIEEEIEASKATEIEEVSLPRKTVLLKNDSYLDSRRFLPIHYKLFEPCETNHFLEKKLREYIVFRIYQKGKLVSWLARSKRSKEWHKENLRLSKEDKEQLVLRYRNSDGTEFDKIVGGYDDITDKTKTVILVEGIFDKVGTDYLLNLHESELIRCCFTFGSKVSDNQINLLREKKSVKNIILLYDLGTIKLSKGYAFKLSRYFNTKVAVCKTENDPNDMEFSEMSEIMSKLQTPIEFFTNNLESKI